MDPNECIRLLGRALNNDQPAEALPYLKDYSEWLAGGGFPATFEAMHNMLDHLRTHLYRVVDQAADGYGLLDEADDRPVRARLRGNEAHLLGSSVRHRLTFEVSSQLEPVRTGWLDEDQIRRVASCIHNQDPEGLLHLDLGAACRVTIDQAEDATSEVRAVMNFIDDSVVRL